MAVVPFVKLDESSINLTEAAVRPARSKPITE
jgi:hypothetical protein